MGISRKLGRYSFLITSFVVLTVLASVLFVSHSANAGVGPGGSGGNLPGGACPRELESGIPGCPYTGNGQGWFEIPIDTPNPPNKNGYWTNAYRTCSAEGASHIMMYLVFTGEETIADAWVYEFLWSWERSGPYVGNVSVNDANGRFDTFTQAEKGGFTFGRDLGWFCWNKNPPWRIGVSTTINTRTVEPGQTIRWTHRVTNNGPNRTNVPVNWQALNRGDLGTDAVGSFVLPRNTAVGGGASEPSTYLVLESDIGKSLCRATTATPASNTGGTVTSSSACAGVAKRPKVQVEGGDLYVGRAAADGSYSAATSNVTTSTTKSTDGNYYGSWAEYGIVASGVVRNMGSASSYANGAGTDAMCSLSYLTFTNGGTGGCIGSTTLGRYTQSQTAPNVAARFPTNGSTPRLSGTETLNGRQGVFRVNGNSLTLGASSDITINRGQWVVINAPTATVTINRNITYTNGPLSSVADIPQVIIIARTILIADNVSNVDAWLVASDTVNTCGAGGVSPTTALRSTNCTTPLRVNGPVVTNHLLLRRTGGAGAGAQAGVPAEEFNLRADAYIWGLAYDSGTNRLPTALINEVPPRF